MGTINVRRLNDEVVERLKRRAADNNRSLESEARHILEQAVEEGMAEKTRAFRELSREARRQTSVHPRTPAHILIREDRDSGHRDG